MHVWFGDGVNTLVIFLQCKKTYVDFFHRAAEPKVNMEDKEAAEVRTLLMFAETDHLKRTA